MPAICRVEFTEAKAKAIGLDAVAWAKRLIEDGSKVFSDDEATAFRDASLPDLTFIIKDSDNAKLLVSAHDRTPYNTSNLDSQYSARFRIPPATLHGLSEEECKKRAQRFAVGSLIYTVMAGKLPFADLEEELVQHNFEKGVYPEETRDFPSEIAIPILGFWSQEFVEHIAHQTSISSKIIEHIRAHPLSSGITAAGIGVLGLASLVNPALGIAGFSALGPTAGSAAAAWQSSIGIVQAGSAFAWCQSAAMGGSAAGTIVATQGLGAGLTGVALGGMLSGSKDEQAEMRYIWNLFTANVRKVDGGDASKEVELGKNQ
jgi:hypothetical protein